MRDDAVRFRKVYIAMGYTDLRSGIDRLVTLVKKKFDLDPFQKDVLFLFCGRRKDRFKGLVWRGDGFLLTTNGSKAVTYSGPGTAMKWRISARRNSAACWTGSRYSQNPPYGKPPVPKPPEPAFDS